jgi:protoporphyrinogen IX oxidase
MRVSLAFHIIGIVTWLGGLMFLSLALRKVQQPALATPGLADSAQKIWRIFVLGGMCISLLSGVAQLYFASFAHFKMGWFHMKLTLVIVLIGVTVLFGREMRKIARGEPADPKRSIMAHACAASILIVTVFLTMLAR